MDREEVLCVTRSKGGLVRPCGQTPSGVVDLSVIDKLPVLRCNARTLHVFRDGPSDSDHAAMVLVRQALSKALVPYYPLAGRLLHSTTTGELQVSCTGEGVWFVEASANCTLDSVSCFEDVASIPSDKLLPLLEGGSEGAEPLILMQVTKFTCGGYIMGLIFCHSICDGMGAAQFLNAVGEFARGLDQLSVAPLWHRHFLPCESLTPKGFIASSSLLPPPMPNYILEQTNIDIPFHQINLLKQKFHQSTGGQTCSSFEIVAASLWSRRTRAINLSKDCQVKLVFFANCRHLLNPSLPKGFYGNCFFPVTITTYSEKLAQSSIDQVVQLIQEAKTRLPFEFHKWITNTNKKGDVIGEEEDPFAPPLVYTTLFISEWGRLGFNQVDYGHGPPVHVVPIQGSSIIPVGIVGSPPRPDKGIRLLTWCVEKDHQQPFLHNMTNLI
ncbi:hypothetical protein LguiB_000020 [Lonicera macranthoides]